MHAYKCMAHMWRPEDNLKCHSSKPGIFYYYIIVVVVVVIAIVTVLF